MHFKFFYKSILFKSSASILSAEQATALPYSTKSTIFAVYLLSFLGLQDTRHRYLALESIERWPGVTFNRVLHSHYIRSPYRNCFSISIKTVTSHYIFYFYSTKWAIHTPVPHATHRCATFTCRQSLYVLYYQLIQCTTSSMRIVQTTAYGCYSQSH